MNNSILLGKYIYKFLKDDEELHERVKDNIFPLICDEDITFPFIVYSRDTITPNYIKDGLSQENVSFTFHIVTTDYIESLEIANIVRRILDCKRYSDNEVNIIQMRVDNITESFEENAYIQTLNISAICGNSI